MEDGCLFCKIVSGKAPGHVIMEDEKHMAFLDAFPLVEAQSVVIPKKHFPGYAFDMPTGDLLELMAFVQKVAKRIDSKLGSERCMQVFQGYAIDHVHTKLFPVMQVKEKVVSEDNYRKLSSIFKQNWYSGFIVSMSGKEREKENKLQELEDRIKS